ncbi:MAG: bidirectional hydrogenase complex protein HoxU [Verrucomicrobiia bacterium]
MIARTLTIDGQMITASEGQTVLEAARDAGIYIPTLCHIKGLSNIGACRLCLVEVVGSTKLQPACILKVSEGMEVLTNTERLQRYRKMILELLLSERNHICSVCVSNGHCELQKLFTKLGIDHSRYPARNNRFYVDITHPLFGIDHNRCILCTRCLRVCDEVEGAHTWDVADRGEMSRMIIDLNQSWGASKSCTACGKCVEVCPTGALFHKKSAVGEMEHNKEKIEFIVTAREKSQWTA